MTEHSNNNTGVLFQQADGTYTGNITIKETKFDIKSISVDDNAQDLFIHLGRIFVNDVPVGDKKPKIKGSLILNKEKKDFAGWSNVSKKGTEYIGCKISEPYKKQETDEYGNPKDLDDDISNIFND